MPLRPRGAVSGVGAPALAEPARFPRANNAGAMAFVRWLTAADKGHAVIATYGKDRFGAPLFVPESKEWQAAQK